LGITDYGFSEYAGVYLPEYDSLFKTVALEIVNNNRTTNEEIAESINCPLAIVDYVISELESRNYVRVNCQLHLADSSS
jgi:hypothetical protein